MVDRIKELFKVHVHGPSIAFFDVVADLIHSIVGRPVRPEPVAVL
jgi:hypothetical protein